MLTIFHVAGVPAGTSTDISGTISETSGTGVTQQWGCEPTRMVVAATRDDDTIIAMRLANEYDQDSVLTVWTADPSTPEEFRVRVLTGSDAEKCANYTDLGTSAVAYVPDECGTYEAALVDKSGNRSPLS